ncbi:hypothetical protein EZ428_21655 [Pedobacter frigiditerrae]|uniref:Chaperone of endosialidase n=1 Tax=Pedobacter frigiditerrae TaxID=2530452 RepID=A0A4R0MLT8_9SPHI|nr:hypothetical protein EZ428_21655 [Pedobacter frigiditerrae]
MSSILNGEKIQTEIRNDAGLKGDAGAKSGFFETPSPVNYPSAATSWWHLLDVRHSNTTNNYAMQFSGSFFDQQLYFRKTNENAAQSWSRVLLETNGNVGIGTVIPRASLDVSSILNGQKLGTVFGRLNEGDNEGDGTFLGVRGYNTTNDYNGKSFAIEHNFYGQTNSSINFFRGGSRTGGFITFSTFNNEERMRISPNGDVGIGTTAPTEKLSVNGKIRAREIKVEPNPATWPDYVFETDYKVENLEELERYIKTNKHLPEMPTAKEVGANGIELGEMNRLLLKKVEELTLLLIDQGKKNEKQDEMINKLVKELNDVKKIK